MVKQRTADLDAVFRALADPTRREMLQRMVQGERTISELAAPFLMSFAGASKHVRVLERAGLVHRTVRGRTHRCRLQPAALAQAHDWLTFYERFWRERLDTLDAVLQEQEATPPATPKAKKGNRS